MGRAAYAGSMAHTKAHKCCVGFAAAVVISVATAGAEAKTAHASPYTYEQTYGTALRLVKVDLGFKVTEQDADWGYLLFEYSSRESGNRKSRGSFEFVRSRSDVRVSLQLASMPSYHERVLIEKLRRKLKEEHGTPPRPKPVKRTEKSKDKGDDDKKGDGAGKKNTGSGKEKKSSPSR